MGSADSSPTISGLVFSRNQDLHAWLRAPIERAGLSVSAFAQFDDFLLEVRRARPAIVVLDMGGLFLNDVDDVRRASRHGRCTILMIHDWRDIDERPGRNVVPLQRENLPDRYELALELIISASRKSIAESTSPTAEQDAESAVEAEIGPTWDLLLGSWDGPASSMCCFLDAAASIPVIAVSDPMQRTMHVVRRFAKLRYPVLISGELGVELDMVAHEVHRCGAAAETHVLSVDCASLTDPSDTALLTRNLAAAAKSPKTRCGTVFLAKVDETPLPIQYAMAATIGSWRLGKMPGTDLAPPPEHFVRVVRCVRRRP